MKSLKLKKSPEDTLSDFLTRIEEYNANLEKLHHNVAELKLVQRKVSIFHRPFPTLCLLPSRRC